MTIRTESRTTIGSDLREMWAYLCEVGRWPEWAPTVLACWVRGGDRRTGAWLWVEVDLAGTMRAIPGSMLERRVQRLSDRELAAIKAAAESPTRGLAEL